MRLRWWREEEERGMEEQINPEPTWKATEPDVDTRREDTTRAAETIARFRAGGPVAGAGAEDVRPIDPDRLQRITVEQYLPDPADTGSRIPAPTIVPRVERQRQMCGECGQPMPTDFELIQSSIAGATPTDIRDNVVVPFYGQLFAAAPELIPLFAASLVYPFKVYSVKIDGKVTESKHPDAGEPVIDPATGQQAYRVLYELNDDGTVRINPEARQVDLLVEAVVALATYFDIDDETKMETLDAALAKYGRSHTRFDPPARIEEYAAVTTTMLAVLSQLLAERFTKQVETAWRKALEYASGGMLRAQSTRRDSGPGRRRRTV